jgi:hypothetical protein
MKQAFITRNFEDTSLKTIADCNGIIDTYMSQGLRLTLRQLYYQLVSRNIIPNREQAYKSLGNLMKWARLAGLVDWDAIEDRGRRPRIPTEFTGLGDLIDTAISWYRLPRWEGQDHYIELWVEKDALSNVLAPLASEYHVTLMVDKGYSSTSAMYDAAQQRYLAHSQTQNPLLLYLGDHDPSGVDMERDIRARMNLLSYGVDIKVEKVALTWDQVHQHQLPPNPTKKTDSRTKAYVAKYGTECWEVDALRPDILQSLIRDAVEQFLDKSLMDTVKTKEESDKAKLRDFIKGLDL